MRNSNKIILAIIISLYLIYLTSCSIVTCNPLLVSKPDIIYELEQANYNIKDSSATIKLDSNCTEEEIIQPAFDYEELQSKIEYPEYLRCIGKEGRVVVKALIDKHGNCIKVMVESSENDYFNKSALESVFYFKFKPAAHCEDGKLKNVMVWVSIPIRYRLR